MHHSSERLQEIEQAEQEALAAYVKSIRKAFQHGFWLGIGTALGLMLLVTLALRNQH